MEGGRLDSNTGIIIQARMSSSRLPGKVLLPFPLGSSETILGKIYQVLASTGATVVVATSLLKESDPIEDYCKERGFKYYRGSEDNVYSRFHSIQKEFSFREVFRFTADNPLIDIYKMIDFYQFFKSRKCDYAYSTGMPLGMNFEIFKGDILLSDLKLNLSQEEKEHVTLRFKNNPRCQTMEVPLADLSEIRLTIDEQMDYIQANLVEIYLGGNTRLEGIIALKKSFPWLLKINSNIKQVHV